jgi:hypothetical protein
VAVAAGGGEVAGEGAAVGAFGFELGFGAFGAGAFGVGEVALGADLLLAVLAEGIAFAGGISADPVGFGAGVGFGLAGPGGLGAGVCAGLARGTERVVSFGFGAFLCLAGGGDLLISAGLDGCCPRGGLALVLLGRAGCGAGGVCGLLCCGLGGCGVVACGGEGVGEGLGFGFGFGLAGGGGDGGCLGAAAGGLSVGDLGADLGGVEGGGLLTCGFRAGCGLAEQRVEGSQRVLAAGLRGWCSAGRWYAGVVVVAAGAFVAAELAGAASLLRRQRLPAAGPAAGPCRWLSAVSGSAVAGHGVFLPGQDVVRTWSGGAREIFSFHF